MTQQELQDKTTVSEMFEQLEDLKKDMLKKRDFKRYNELDTAKSLIKIVLINAKIKKLTSPH